MCISNVGKVYEISVLLTPNTGYVIRVSFAFY